MTSSGGGFLREVLQGASHPNTVVASPPVSGGGVSSSSHRLSARNSQAVKVILSEAYIRWCSEPDTYDVLETFARELLAAAKPSAPLQAHTPSSGPPSAGRGGSAPQAPAADGSNRYADPQNALADDRQTANQQDAQRSTSPSPPPSPPMRQRHRKELEERRTPSPVQHSTRFLGVDELDAHHRQSPGAASPVSPTTTMHAGPPSLKSETPHNIPHPAHHVVLETATFFDSPGGSSTAMGQPRGSSPTEHAHKYHGLSASGAYAVQPAFQAPLATVVDVPVFYHKSEPEGGLREVNVEELDALATFFSSKPASIIKPAGGGGRGGRGPGATVDIDVNKTVRKLQFAKICKEVFGIPVWLKDCLFRRIALANGSTENQPLNYHYIKKFYDTAFGRLTPNRRLFELLRQNPRSSVLTLDDLKLGVKYLVDNHAGLEFLKQPEFQDSYCRTVAIRIVYELEVRHQRCVAWPQFDRSDLPNVMRELDDTPDINQVLRYFSYEHFYVLYCRFWELDGDRDQLVGLSELQQYGQGSLTTSVLQRVVTGAGRKLTSGVPGKLDFEDFVYFCLSEEDKNHPQAVYYWFRVLDLDCDGVLSGFELGKFFEDNRQRFQELFGDELRYEDMMCQMLDMVGYQKTLAHPTGLSLADLKSCDCPANFFNMIFNATKFINFEHRDPFAEHQQKLQPEKTDWDRFARLEYDRMANEVS